MVNPSKDTTHAHSFDAEKIIYLHLKGYSNLPILEINSVDDYKKMLFEKQPKTIFICEKGEEQEFLFIDKGFGYAISSNGFKTVTDLLEANKLGFTGCGAKFGLSNNDLLEGSTAPDGGIYYAIKRLEYSTFYEFTEAYSKGFGGLPRENYITATQAGFKNAQDYLKAKEFGFDDSLSYYEASELGIGNRRNYIEYLKLKRIKEEYGFGSFDEAHVFAVLNRKDLGRIKELKSLREILNAEKPLDPTGRAVQKWYTESLNIWAMPEKDPFEQFLQTNPQLINLGLYDPIHKVFENYSDIKVLVDGSNVAWNAGDRFSGDRPDIKNIHLAIQRLKGLGFADILVICDANLEYDIQNKALFNDLMDLNLVKKVPFREDADLFILNYAKQFKARIVTNDRFEDLAAKDRWIRENAQNICIRFMIVDDNIQFSNSLGNVIDRKEGKLSDFDFKGFFNEEVNKPRKYLFY
jgi:DNA-binding PadR family transcriptional regulator